MSGTLSSTILAQPLLFATGIVMGSALDLFGAMGPPPEKEPTPVLVAEAVLQVAAIGAIATILGSNVLPRLIEADLVGAEALVLPLFMSQRSLWRRMDTLRDRALSPLMAAANPPAQE